MEPNLKTLIQKLNPISRRAVSGAAAIAVTKGHYEVEVEHVILALCEQADSDFSHISKRHGIRGPKLHEDLELAIIQLKNGNERTPVFSNYLIQLLQRSWLIASLDNETLQIRTSHLLLAMISESSLAQIVFRISTEFQKYRLDELKHNLQELTRSSSEEDSIVDAQGGTASGASHSDVLDGQVGATSLGQAALERYTVDLTKRAREGMIDPVIGREKEIRQVVDILLRRRQNNPILTGEAGVGKTAVVEGLALRVALQDVPAVLQNVAIHTLDMGLLQAGASVKGEFESRLKNIIEEIKRSSTPIILFIDEAHTIIGAGGQAGQNDAANLLKPALARGELRTIGATTWSEYKKYFEKDAAFARRFQVVKVEEPSEDMACAMVRGLVPVMERHFGLHILDEAIKEAVKLSHRYIGGRQLPDKAISLLDTACAKVALGLQTAPAVIEDQQEEIHRISQEVAALQREGFNKKMHAERLAELGTLSTKLTATSEILKFRLAAESEIVAKLRSLQKSSIDRTHIEGDDFHAEDDAEIRNLRQQLSNLQGESPLVPLQVDKNVIATIVSEWTGIPLGSMVKDEIKTLLSVDTSLKKRVIGQDHALEIVAQRIRTSRANLEDPNKPKGVFLFVGPSGVGKTETALALAEVLYGGERKVITVNMSEYQEPHSVSGLKGSPPGYVGYGEGGVLTEAVRISPYSVILLDEIEKAHADVIELFFQVFDKGVMEDGEGREIDFKNTVIILTSNVASSQIMQACINLEEDSRPSMAEIDGMIRPSLMKAFKPAFLGRLKIVPFYPIPDSVLSSIIKLKLGRIEGRIKSHHKAEFQYDNSVVKAILSRCVEVDSGARNVDNIINETILPSVADLFLNGMAEGRAVSRIKVTASKTGAFKYCAK